MIWALRRPRWRLYLWCLLNAAQANEHHTGESEARRARRPVPGAAQPGSPTAIRARGEPERNGNVTTAGFVRRDDSQPTKGVRENRQHGREPVNPVWRRERTAVSDDFARLSARAVDGSRSRLRSSSVGRSKYMILEARKLPRDAPRRDGVQLNAYGFVPSPRTGAEYHATVILDGRADRTDRYGACPAANPSCGTRPICP